MNIYISERGLFSNDRHDYPISHANPVNKVEAPGKVSDNRSVVREAETSFVAENTPAYNISISSLGKAALQSMVELSKNFDSYYDQMAADYTNNISEDKVSAEQTQGDRITDETVNEEGADATVVQNEAVNGTTGIGQNVLTPVNDLDTRIQEEIYEPAEDDSLQTIYDNVVSDIENGDLFEETEGILENEVVEEPGSVNVLGESEIELNTEEAFEVPAYEEVEPGADRLLQPTVEEQETQEQVREDARPDNNPVIRQAMEAYNYQMSYSINLAMTQ
ncbi:MAG: hypothetical protein K6F93_03580 [Lachnospiraceae bacterium]|nr:hypothetical protein [Lachnospiraceae bacterium]